MESEYPLFPELPPAGAEQAQELIDKFKTEMTKIANGVLGELYVDVADHIESDAWINYRNDMMAGFRNYGNRMIQGEHDFKTIRQEIYKEFRDDIIADLNQDLVKEVAELKADVERLNEWNRRSF